MTKTISLEFAYNESADSNMYFKQLLLEMILNDVIISNDNNNNEFVVSDNSIVIKLIGEETAIRKILSYAWFPDFVHDVEWDEILHANKEQNKN